LLLQVQAIGEKDEEIKKRLGHSHRFDEQREPIGCRLEAVETYDEDAIEETYGREVMQAHDAGYNEIVLEFRSSDHGSCGDKVLCPAQGLANADGLVFEVCDWVEGGIEGLNSFVAA